MQRFLIIQTAFIGDVVLATSLVEKLHAFYPDAKIDILVRKGNESLLANHPYLNEVLVWDKKRNKNRNLLNLLIQIRGKGYDRVINVQRFASTGFLTAFSKAKETIGFDKNPFSRFFSRRIAHRIGIGEEPAHEVSRNLRLIRHFTDDSFIRPVLYPSSEDYERVRTYQTDPYITIGPASVWFTKQFPMDQWISFIEQLPQKYRVFLLGAPSDIPLCEEIMDSSAPGFVFNLCGKLSFLQSAALMKKAAMNYVNDSAPLHFASAVNAPVTAIYCSTIPAFGFGPLSDERFIVEVRESLACRPCGLHGYKKCPLGHFHCARHISNEQLLETCP
jgi:ADP-heptose:LPS heptosyltransferase